MKIKIMTFNVCHFKNINTNRIEYVKIIKFIKDKNIDIVGFNEVYGNKYDKKIMVSQIEYIAKMLGYYYYFSPSTKIKGVKYGNGIISKYPINMAHIIKIPMPKIRSGTAYYEKRSILKANINKLNLNIYITHLGLNEDEQKLGINTILNSININNSILMGDFNIENNNVLIKSFNKNMKSILNNSFTFPSLKPTKKLDYIFVSKNIKIIHSYIPNFIISDHLPIISTIEI